MTNYTPIHSSDPRIVLPAAADVDVVTHEGRPAIRITCPDTGAMSYLVFAAGHPGDACTTISALDLALRNAEGQYHDRELVLSYGEAS